MKYAISKFEDSRFSLRQIFLIFVNCSNTTFSERALWQKQITRRNNEEKNTGSGTAKTFHWISGYIPFFTGNWNQTPPGEPLYRRCLSLTSLTFPNGVLRMIWPKESFNANWKRVILLPVKSQFHIISRSTNCGRVKWRWYTPIYP